MTIERASELVAKLRQVNQQAAIDLFCHFDDLFQLSQRNLIVEFARSCGYTIAKSVAVLPALRRAR
jgi:hypothetical protein